MAVIDADGRGRRDRGGAIRYRPGRPTTSTRAPAIWRAGIDDYQARLNQPSMPDGPRPAPAPVRPPARHGSRPLLGRDRARRGRAWSGGRLRQRPARACGSSRCCSSCPGTRRAGIGRRSWTGRRPGRRAPGRPGGPGPRRRRSTRGSTPGACARTPPSRSRTALYARRGWCPGSRSGGCSGEVRRWPAVPPLPAGLSRSPFEAVDRDASPTATRRLAGRRRRRSTADAHRRRAPGDHGSCGGTAGSGFLLRDRGDGRPVGYVYGSGIGRLGPLAALDPALHPR